MVQNDKNLLLPAFPSRITLELTNKCNFNCSFCPRKLMAKHQGFMEMNLINKLVHEIKDKLPVAVVPFFRGEPILHPQFVEILKVLKKENIGPIQLTTNGSLLNESIAQDILEIGVDFISFSLDTTDPTLYAKTRGTPLFAQVMDNVHRFLALREEMGASSTEVQVSTIEISQHQEGIPEFIAYWQGKVDRVRVYTEHSTDGNPGSIMEPLPPFDHRMACHKLWSDMVIYWDGEVAICNHDWTRTKADSIGTVCETTILDVWNSHRYNQLREQHSNGTVAEDSLCGGCDHWKMYYLPDGYLGKIYRANK